MDRLISEKQIINAIKAWAIPLQVSNSETIENLWVNDVCELIKAIPSAEPKIVPIAEIKFDDDKLHEIVEEAVKNIEIEPKWISVNDEIPQMEEWVLCQCRANIYEVLKYTSHGWYHDDAHCYMNGFVIAWMPLPEPYKAQESEDKI